MRIDILSLFPQMFDSPLGESIIGRAKEKGIVDIRCHQIRDYTESRQNQVDDYPYGGGQGCVMQAQPLYSCWKAVYSQGGGARTIYLSPRGNTFTQEDARRLAESYDRLILVCGHYEGVDQRFVEACVDEEISMGDFVMTGGEIPAMALADAVCRLLPGVLSDESCFTDESHWNGLLEYPQFTRPEVWEGRQVPDVLLSGDHGAVENWRRKQAFLTTLTRRPDMFRKLVFSKQDLKLLAELQQEIKDPQALEILDSIHTGRITVRRTSQRDLPGLSKLYRQLKWDNCSLASLVESLEEFEDYVHFSIYADDHGFCGYCDYSVEEDTAIISMYVMGHARKKGIGTYALAFVLDDLFKRDVSLCILPEEVALTPGLVRRLGFEEDTGGQFVLARERWQNRSN